jgi:hypothetical protein
LPEIAAKKLRIAIPSFIIHNMKPSSKKAGDDPGLAQEMPNAHFVSFILDRGKLKRKVDKQM